MFTVHVFVGVNVIVIVGFFIIARRRRWVANKEACWAAAWACLQV
jgi:hypothetical protein